MKNSITILAFVFIVVSSFAAQAQHQLLMRSGEVMNGEVKSLNDGTVKFVFKGNEMNFKVADIASISFSGDVKPAASTPASGGSTTKGVSYVMAGRKMIREPKVDNLTMEKGIVVVEITIDKYGNVIKAVPGIEGSTTTSTYLYTKAKQAAESVKFDTSPIMPQSQTGSITITF